MDLPLPHCIADRASKMNLYQNIRLHARNQKFMYLISIHLIEIFSAPNLKVATLIVQLELTMSYLETDIIGYLLIACAILVFTGLVFFRTQRTDTGEVTISILGWRVTSTLPPFVFAMLFVLILGSALVAIPRYLSGTWDKPTSKEGFKTAKDLKKKGVKTGTPNEVRKWTMDNGTRSSGVFITEPFTDTDIRRYAANPVKECRVGRRFRVCYGTGPDASVIVYGPTGSRHPFTQTIQKGDCLTTERFCYMIIGRQTPTGVALGTIEERAR